MNCTPVWRQLIRAWTADRAADCCRYRQSLDPVERFFYRIKQFRRIATRYDKQPERFASFVALTAAVIWLA